MLKNILTAARRAGLLAAATTAALTTAHAQTYPLDPLTATEITRVTSILKDNHLVGETTYYNIINLKEPPKKEVQAWQPGTPMRREAFVSFYDYAKPGITEAIVDLNAGKPISVKTIPNVIGMGLEADSLAAETIVRKDANYIAALKRRGISIDDVVHRTIFPTDLGLAPIGHREQLVIQQGRHRRNPRGCRLHQQKSPQDRRRSRPIQRSDRPELFQRRLGARYPQGPRANKDHHARRLLYSS
jgi:primary-amine oxidase